MSILPVRRYPPIHPPFCLFSVLSTLFIKTARFKSQDSVGPIPQPKPRKRSPTPSKALFKALLKLSSSQPSRYSVDRCRKSGCLHQETNVKTSFCVRRVEPWRRSSLRSSLRGLVCLGPISFSLDPAKFKSGCRHGQTPLSHPCFLPTVLVLHFYVFSTCFLPITFVFILHGVWIWV
ncbi:hypothetical protein B0H11DRAFT_2128689, partial [Mycena galericulata]